MYSMKETCSLVQMPYETLKYYCKEGLIPGVQRDAQNHRVFDERTVAWINSLNCLKRCGMGISEMKEYLTLCLQGDTSIPAREVILAHKRRALQAKLTEIEACLAYIDAKQQFYEDVLAGKTAYISNLLPRSAAAK